MIQHRIRGLNSLLCLLQGLFAAGIYWGWFWYYQMLFRIENVIFYDQYLIYSGLILVGLVLDFMTRSSQTMSLVVFERSLLALTPVSLRQLAFALGCVLVFLVLAKDVAISRIFLVSYTPLLFGMLLWTNSYTPHLLARHFFRGLHVGRTLLVGTQERALALQGWLSNKAEFGFQTVGLLTDEAEEPGMYLPVLGSPSHVEEVISTHRISQVILLAIPFDPVQQNVVSVALKLGVRLLIFSNLQEYIRRPLVHFEDAGIQFLALHDEPLENPFHRALKRACDIAFASMVLAFVFPVSALIVWICHRLQSPGPLFFRQQRAGIQNREFTILKFRSMHVSEANDEAKQATKDDHRVFSAGRWLRRFSIDEIPQFINVLRGDMSVVGPRPHLIEHNRQFAELLANYQIRSFVRPGVTGLAQVRGFRGEAKTREAISARLQSDIAYLENWSPLLDISIVCRTFIQMVAPPKSAY